MGILISGALALLPAEGGFDASIRDIYIDGTDIAGIDAAPEGFSADELIDGSGMLAMPGLVNAHTHTYMSTMRNVADDLPFDDWLMGRIEPIEARLEPEDAYWGSLASQAEMIRSGTTCFSDMHMHAGQTARAAVDSGMRAVISRGLVGDAYDESDRRLAEALSERREFAGCGRLSFLLGPHAPYSCGKGYLRMVSDVARQEGLGVHIHVAESRFEDDTIRGRHGCSPVEYVRDSGILELPSLGLPVVAAHCVRVDARDMGILAEAGASVASCPASNMKLGNGFAPVPEMLAAGINVCIGTDGAASNNAQSMFREMGLMALIHKGTHDTPQCVSAAEALAMATGGAARALGLPTGEIAVGRRADVVLIDLDSPQLTPLGDPVAAMAYSACGAEVDTVIIDGKVVMRRRELLTVDEERVRAEMRRICRRLADCI